MYTFMANGVTHSSALFILCDAGSGEVRCVNAFGCDKEVDAVFHHQPLHLIPLVGKDMISFIGPVIVAVSQTDIRGVSDVIVCQVTILADGTVQFVGTGKREKLQQQQKPDHSRRRHQPM